MPAAWHKLFTMPPTRFLVKRAVDAAQKILIPSSVFRPIKFPCRLRAAFVLAYKPFHVDGLSMISALPNFVLFIRRKKIIIFCVVRYNKRKVHCTKVRSGWYREKPSAYVPAHLREHPAVQSKYRCGNGGRRSRTRTAQYDPYDLHAGL